MSINYELRFAICDDCPKERQSITQMVIKYLDERDYVITLDEFGSGEELLGEDISVYDLAILDIFMGEKNGIETARELMKRNSCIQIIFCSTSSEYAVESYDVSALRYFLKPVAEEKMFHTLDWFFHAHTMLRTLKYRVNRMQESVYLSEVLWVEADGHKCIIHTKKGDFSTSTSFNQICEQLENADFVKPIRYALVSLQAVATVPTDVFTLTDGTTVSISRSQRAEMKKVFNDYKMKYLLRRGGIRG